MGNDKNFFQKIHFPTLAICLGCIFTAPPNHREQGVLICKEWAILSMLLICMWTLFRVWRKRKDEQNEDRIAKTFFLIGLLECAIALLQYVRLFASYNPFFKFTGSFTNPSMLAIMLSVCAPIGLYYIKQNKGTNRIKWIAITFVLILFLVLSTSRTGIFAVTCSYLILFVKPASESCSLWKANRATIFPLILLIPLLTGLHLLKGDSASGRILIWTNCMNMFMDKPLMGWGISGFDAHYMPQQATYFAQHPSSPFSNLADNVSHPFNEFLLIAVNYGIIGLALLLLLSCVFVRHLVKCNNKHKILLVSISMSIVVCAIFSYPYQMPIIWVVSTYILALTITSSPNHHVAKSILLSLAILTLLFKSTYRLKERWNWTALMDNPCQELPETILQQYHRLYSKLQTDSYFLYNYGAMLHQHGRYRQSNKILHECVKTYNDYNVQMLIADNYRQLGMSQEAISAFSYAALMVPCRFLPLYYKMKTYEESGNIITARHIARAILNKHIKVRNSPAVERIRTEAKQLIQKNADE